MTSGYQSREFLRALLSSVRDNLSPSHRDARIEVQGAIGKLWFGNRDIHYECNIRARIGTIEIGLHFEADPLTNARLLGAFRSRKTAVRKGLGSAARLEEWDRGWSRIWEPHETTSLDDALRGRLAKRLSRYVAVLEPILREELPAEVSWRLPTTRRTA